MAISARLQEDNAEAADWQATKVAKGWTHGLPPGASDIDESDFAIGTRREQARNMRVYEGSLTKSGEGTLFLAGSNTWHGESTVRGGKLSVVGSHASPIDVRGGTLGGGGRWPPASTSWVAHCSPASRPRGGTDHGRARGSRQLHGRRGDLRIDRHGRFLTTIYSDSDYTSLLAAGDLRLDGGLSVDVQGALTRGTVLTIMDGSAIHGRFRGLAEVLS